MEDKQRISPTPAGSDSGGELPAMEIGVPLQPGLTTGQKIGIGLGVVAIVLALGVLFYGLVSHPVFTSILRDVAIIVLALVTIITTLLLAVLLFQLQSLMVLLRDEVQPILRSINETSSTVRGTTTFVSDSVVSPVIEVAGYASGVRQAFKTAIGIRDGTAKSKTLSQEARAKAKQPAGPKGEPREPTA